MYGRFLLGLFKGKKKKMNDYITGMDLMCEVVVASEEEQVAFCAICPDSLKEKFWDASLKTKAIAAALLEFATAELMKRILEGSTTYHCCLVSNNAIQDHLDAVLAMKDTYLKSQILPQFIKHCPKLAMANFDIIVEHSSAQGLHNYSLLCPDKETGNAFLNAYFDKYGRGTIWENEAYLFDKFLPDYREPSLTV
jgi:hypothetical protein